MKPWKTISDIRREYGALGLQESKVSPEPFAQFDQWFSEVLDSEMSDPTAMVLSTVDEQGHPDSRVVLLKGILDGHFVFYTNYESVKAHQLAKTPYGALNFYWPQMSRQVRVRGAIEKTSAQVSDTYFASRPLGSQISALISPQSREILGRDGLDTQLNELLSVHQNSPPLRPASWGGYGLKPVEFEFWQGRDNRLHDRIQYALINGEWQHHRLAP